MKSIKLDGEEKEFLKSFERGEWKQVRGVKVEVKKHQGYAVNTLKKDRK